MTRRAPLRRAGPGTDAHAPSRLPSASSLTDRFHDAAHRPSSPIQASGACSPRLGLRHARCSLLLRRPRAEDPLDPAGVERPRRSTAVESHSRTVRLIELCARAVQVASPSRRPSRRSCGVQLSSPHQRLAAQLSAVTLPTAADSSGSAAASWQLALRSRASCHLRLRLARASCASQIFRSWYSPPSSGFELLDFYRRVSGRRRGSSAGARRSSASLSRPCSRQSGLVPSRTALFASRRFVSRRLFLRRKAPGDLDPRAGPAAGRSTADDCSALAQLFRSRLRAPRWCRQAPARSSAGRRSRRCRAYLVLGSAEVSIFRPRFRRGASSAVNSARSCRT